MNTQKYLNLDNNPFNPNPHTWHMKSKSKTKQNDFQASKVLRTGKQRKDWKDVAHVDNLFHDAMGMFGIKTLYV